MSENSFSVIQQSQKSTKDLCDVVEYTVRDLTGLIKTTTGRSAASHAGQREHWTAHLCTNHRPACSLVLESVYVYILMYTRYVPIVEKTR